MNKYYFTLYDITGTQLNYTEYTQEHLLEVSSNKPRILVDQYFKLVDEGLYHKLSVWYYYLNEGEVNWLELVRYQAVTDNC